MEKRRTMPGITIAEDGMSAFLMLYPLQDGEPDYTPEEIMGWLQASSVVYGIDERAVAEAVSGKKYGESVCVAHGTRPVEGKDGYFIYNFRREPNRKPVEREDGSVDYWAVNLIETVVRGQAIAQYRPAVQGKPGMTVQGAPLLPPKVKDKPPLKGRGFVRTADNRTYIAAMDGKIEYQDDHIVINPVHEVFGDADMKIGHINFPGAIIIHGNVCAGMAIKAAESITVDGTIEAARLEAGKDIIVRNGVKGGSNAKVTAKGSVMAKYIEYAEVEAGGSIHADAIINCKVYCREKVILTGRHGSITGGRMMAVQGVEAKDIGNEVGQRTVVNVGAELSVLQRSEVLRKKIADVKGNLERIEKGIEDFDKLISMRTDLTADDPRRMQLMKIRIRDTATLAADQAELDNLNKIIVDSRGAKVMVLGTVFAGTEIGIDNIRVVLKDYQEHVEFVKRMDKIMMNSLVSKAR